MNVEVISIQPGTRLRRHGHEGTHVCALADGAFQESLRGQVEQAVPGTVRVSPPATHDLDFGPAGARCVIIEAADGDLPDLDRSLFLRDDRWLAALVSRLDAALVGGDPARSLDIDGLVIELFAQIRRRCHGRAAGAPPPWLREARDLLHTNAQPLSLSQLAITVGIHRVHLAREFRDHFGVTVGAYARRLRLARARRLLRDTEMPIAQVAAVTGFADQSHLTRAVRRTFGMTPGVLRRTLR